MRYINLVSLLLFTVIGFSQNLYDAINYSFEVDGSIIYIEDDFLGYQPVLNTDFNLSSKLQDTFLNENIYLGYQYCFDKSYCYKEEVKKINL